VFVVNVVPIKMMKLLPRHQIDHHLFDKFPLFYQIHFPLRLLNYMNIMSYVLKKEVILTAENVRDHV